MCTLKTREHKSTACYLSYSLIHSKSTCSVIAGSRLFSQFLHIPVTMSANSVGLEQQKHNLLSAIRFRTECLMFR